MRRRNCQAFSSGVRVKFEIVGVEFEGRHWLLRVDVEGCGLVGAEGAGGGGMGVSQEAEEGCEDGLEPL